jgi:acetylornithine deacetylase
VATRFRIRRSCSDEARQRDEAGVTEIRIDEVRLVDWASKAIGTPSFTGSEEAMAELMRDTFLDMGLQVQWQQVEDGRANVLGTLAGTGGGPSLMFNGHMDTSYSGREPWLRHVPGFQPEAFVEDGRLYGLGISNMKGALACYVEAVHALGEAGVRLRGDLMIAAVCGEIEKTQQGDAQGAEYRGYAAGSRYLVTHGGVADMCILGEPTENKLVLAHFGTLWLKLTTHGPFIHTAFSEGRRDENSILKMRRVLDAVLAWLPSWEEEMSYGDVRGVANVGSIEGGFGWRASRTPHRTDLYLDLRVPPDVEMAEARRKALEFARSLEGVDAEVYVTAPGAEIDEAHPLVACLGNAHEEVFGAPPERDVTRWFSDASVLTRYGIQTVNYGTSSGLPDAELGENLAIDGLVKTAEVYARAAKAVCGVA